MVLASGLSAQEPDKEAMKQALVCGAGGFIGKGFYKNEVPGRVGQPTARTVGAILVIAVFDWNGVIQPCYAVQICYCQRRHVHCIDFCT